MSAIGSAQLVIEQHTQSTLKRELSRRANFDSTDVNGMLGPPENVVRDILAQSAIDNIPPLNGISPIPIVRSDGTLYTEPGYDRESGILYSPPPGFELPEIPENPTDDDLRAAVRILHEPFMDCPYRGASDRAHVLAMMITLVLRMVIRGCIPGFAVSANLPGTGKTKQAELVSMIVLGWGIDALPPTSEDEEWRKKITTELMKGAPFVVIDNVMDS